MADKDVGVGKEFPTQWHKDTYLENLQRELDGAELRGDEDQAANAKAELHRLNKRAAPKTEPKAEPAKEADEEKSAK